MNIRAATPEDLPAILEIYNHAILHTTATYDESPESLASRQDWFARRQQEGYPALVATSPDGAVLGWSALNPFHHKPCYRFTAENSVYVAPACQNQGIGRKLLEHLLEAAHQGPWQSLIAVIDAQTPVSIHLHASLGFQTVARLEKVGFKFNRWLDVVYMQLLLRNQAPGPSPLNTDTTRQSP